jgi:hypothetical protein
MQRKSIAEYTKVRRAQNPPRKRDTLRRDGRLLQAIARAYYVVYVLASFTGGKYGVKATHIRGRERVVDRRFSHSELPAVVYALYSGLKKETVTDPGSTPGIGSGNYDEREAYRQADRLVQLRFEADYGPGVIGEPYDSLQADAWLMVAKKLTQDLESVL